MEATLETLRRNHLNRSDHGINAGLTEQNLIAWVFRMNAWLCLIKEAYGFQDLQEMLRYVQRNYITKLELLPHANCKPIVPSEMMLAGMQAWEAINDLHITDVIKITPPNCLAALTHWKIIMRLLEGLAMDQVNQVCALMEYRGLDGKLVDPFSQLHLSRPKFVDIHLHPDKVMRDLKTTTWSQVFGMVHCNIDAQADYLIASQVFPDGWRAMQKLEGIPNMYFTLGIHPHCAEDNDVHQLLKELVPMLAGPKVIGMGEMGLDYYRHHKSQVRQRQQEMLRRQAKLAQEMEFPVVIHCRNENHSNDAMQDCVSILADILPSNHPIVLHSWMEMLDKYDDWKFVWPDVHVSLNSGLLHKVYEEYAKAGKPGHLYQFECPTRTMIQRLPLDKIVLESDSPYLPPPGYRSPNVPWWLGDLVKYIGSARNLAPRQIIEVTRRNACKFFNLLL